MSALLLPLLGVLVFLVVAIAVYGLYVLVNPTRTASDRLREISEQDVVPDEVSIVIGGSDEAGIVGAISKLAEPESLEEKSRMRRTLVQAGYRHRYALEIYNSIRVTGGVCLPLFTLPFAASLDFMRLAGAVVVAAAAGYYLPYMMVNNKVTKRKDALLRTFPDCLDLLVSSVEAGLGLDAAFRRVAAEMESTAPDLSREFKLVNHEISAGVPRVEALRHLELRTGLEEVRSLVNMLSQAERFGTSIAKSLRVHANTVRQKRMSKAEEEAAKVSPKLTVVMILFLLPVLMSTLLGPAMIRVFRTLGAQ